jgi:hypothetical protein
MGNMLSTAGRDGHAVPLKDLLNQLGLAACAGGLRVRQNATRSVPLLERGRLCTQQQVCQAGASHGMWAVLPDPVHGRP